MTSLLTSQSCSTKSFPKPKSHSSITQHHNQRSVPPSGISTRKLCSIHDRARSPRPSQTITMTQTKRRKLFRTRHRDQIRARDHLTRTDVRCKALALVSAVDQRRPTPQGQPLRAIGKMTVVRRSEMKITRLRTLAKACHVLQLIPTCAALVLRGVVDAIVHACRPETSVCEAGAQR